VGSETTRFGAFIDATGQHTLSASDLPFPSLRRQEALKESATQVATLDDDTFRTRRTGGIDIDDNFRPRVDRDVSNKLYCVSVPFLLHKLPFVQGITSAHEMGSIVAEAIILDAGRDGRVFTFDTEGRSAATDSAPPEPMPA
jgi:hypothetical protein